MNETRDIKLVYYITCDLLIVAVLIKENNKTYIVSTNGYDRKNISKSDIFLDRASAEAAYREALGSRIRALQDRLDNLHNKIASCEDWLQRVLTTPRPVTLIL